MVSSQHILHVKSRSKSILDPGYFLDSYNKVVEGLISTPSLRGDEMQSEAPKQVQLRGCYLLFDQR